MPTLYVTQPGAIVRHAQGRLLVEVGGRVLLCALAREVEAVVVFGPVQVTTAALCAVWERGGCVAYVSSHGRLRGRATPGEGRNAGRRLQQFARHSDTDFRLAFARTSVEAKLRNSRAVLGRLARNGHGGSLRTASRHIKTQLVSLRSASDTATLRGHEGAAAVSYFAALRDILPGELAFGARARRPAPDAVNALLNLGYTLVGHELWTALEACGLDPFVGFFHAERLNRPALALDLLEEFRSPLIDRLVLSLFNTRALQKRDFDVQNGEARLAPTSLKKFLTAYEKAVNVPFTDRRSGERVTFRRLFLLQARRVSQTLESGTLYQPYLHQPLHKKSDLRLKLIGNCLIFSLKSANSPASCAKPLHQ